MFSNIILEGLEEKIVSRNSKILVNQPAFHLSLVFFLGFLHIGLLYLGIPSPMTLLFVPLIYLACKANGNLNTTKNIFKHYIPFIILSIINISCHAADLFQSAEFVKTYNIFNLIFTLIVGVFYLIPTFSLNRINNLPKRDHKSLLYHKLIGQLCILLCFMKVMGGIKLLILVTGDTDFSIIIIMFWLPFFILIRLLIVLTWYRAERQTADSPFEGKIEKMNDDENLNRNKIQLLQYLEQSEIFLDPNLTLPILATKVGMSEREFSKLLNQYLGNSFYQLIAKYRIAYAVKLIDENANRYTIDALAGHCGFNSKTSFNKYFKEYTGSNPSEFRAKVANN
jgi:AraC-like DNA-binding protein